MIKNHEWFSNDDDDDVLSQEENIIQLSSDNPFSSSEWQFEAA